MMKSILLSTAFLFVALVSCEPQKKSKDNDAEKASKEIKTGNILDKVDRLDQNIKAATADFDWVISLDHHRMAKEEGVYTPPAVVTIFSDSQINSKLLSGKSQLIGLDLPFKVLSYSEADTIEAKLAYTSADFIAKRQSLSRDELMEFSNKTGKVLGGIDQSVISETHLDSVGEGFGIIRIASDFDFQTTVKKLKDVVNAQSDTRWFGEIDYQSEAEELGIALNPTVILFFGGPAPGGQAMKTTPKIGLDAFCQKLLVFENERGEVWVAFNDIVAFSELYYGFTTKPQQGINKRLMETFKKAVQKM